MDPSVFPASSSDLGRVVSVMDAGFRDDPIASWAAGTEDGFSELHPRFVEICATPALPKNGVHVLGDFRGAAVWYPPGTELDVEALSKAFEQAPRPDRISTLFELIDACEKYRPAQPYWELELLAVDPKWQGQGYGAVLLKHGLEITDSEGLPVYLESSNPANLSFYRRHGFELLAEVHIPDAPGRFPMFREARR